jgi:MFS family permease
LLVDTVSRDKVGKWLGVALSCNNIGMVLSPLFGGVIYHAAGKYAVFGIMMALIAVDAILRLFMIAKPMHVRQDQIGSVEITEDSKLTNSEVTESNVFMGLDNTPQLSRRTSNQPILNLDIPATRVTGILRLVRSPRLLAALYGIFLNECVNASLMAVVPLFVSKTFGWSTLGAGLIFLTIALPSIGGFVAGWLSDRFGPKRVAVSGLLMAGPAIILLRFIRHKSTHQIVLLCVLLTIIGKFFIEPHFKFANTHSLQTKGISTNLFLSSLSADLSFVADEESRLQKAATGILDDGITHMSLYAASFSLMNSAMAAATLFGPLFMGWLNENHGWEVMTAVLGSVVLSGIGPCLCFTGDKGA